MVDIMYEVPNDKDIVGVTIDRDTILHREQVVYLRKGQEAKLAS